MKGDFSRLTFRARKHYSALLHQQGRVWLDSDWNEAVQDEQFLLEQELIDIVGRCGVPAPGDAFALAPNPAPGAAPDDFLIGGGPGASGHLYAQGLLCQIDEPASYLTQPDLPNPARITMPATGQTVTALVYLEVWQRLITFLEDPSIREVALGGPDTATRLKTIAQVKVAIVRAGTTCATAQLPTDGSGTLTTLQPTDTQPPDPCRLPDPAAYTGRENHLYRVEVHDAGDVLGAATGSSFRLPLAANAAVAAISITLGQALTAGQRAALVRSGAVVISDNEGRIERIPLAAISADGLTITLARGLQTAFLTASAAAVTGGAARFKWSRDNAAFAVPVTAISTDRLTLTLGSLGRDQATALRSGDLVEICDDASELGPGRGHLTYLTANPNPDLFTVSLADALPAGFATPNPAAAPPVPDRHLILRRWDGLGLASAAFGESSTPDMNLGDGVHIQFGGSDLRPGDYWQFAARALDGSIELLTDAPPAGVKRRRCKLAIVQWTAGDEANAPAAFAVLEDCRRIFPPLTDLWEPGIHVTGIFAVDDRGATTPLVNDTNVPFNRISGGIQVVCDAPVDPASISRPTCFVSMETPNTPSNTAGPPAAYTPVNLAANVNAASSVIAWIPAPPARTFMSTLTNQIPPNDRGILTRLNLKGNFIWARNNPNLYLDGETFGVRPNESPSTLLNLPSGDKRRGGDFEMWFWMTAAPPVAPFEITVASAGAVAIRGEGVAELVADLILTGAGGSPTPAGTPVPLANIQVFITPAVNVTSAGLPNSLLDAILLIDDPTVLNTAALTVPRPPVIGVGGTGLNFRNGAAPNAYIGQLASANSVIFTGVPLDPPGPNGNRVLRIKNVRINASQLGTPAGAQASVAALVSISGVSVPIRNPVQTVGIATQGARFQVLLGRTGNALGVFSFNRLEGINTALAANPADQTGVINFRLRYGESYAAAFKAAGSGVVGIAEPAPHREAGFDNVGGVSVTGPPLPAGLGAVTSGTRFRAIFSNVPAGVRIFVTTRDIPPPTAPLNPPDVPPARAILIRSDADGAGGGPPGPTSPGGVPLGTEGRTGGFPIAEITTTGGTGAATWEWIVRDRSDLAIDQPEFGILIAAARGDQTGASPGTASVQMSLAPLSNAAASSNVAPVPRFVGTSSPQSAFTVLAGGAGGILFPFPPVGPVGPVFGVTGSIERVAGEEEPAGMVEAAPGPSEPAGGERPAPRKATKAAAKRQRRK